MYDEINMRKDILLIIILTVIIIILAGVLLLPKNNKQNPPPNVTGIQVALPKANEEIFSPLKITGITNGDGWNGFEGQVGTVRLFDSTGNQLSLGILTATTDWMNPPVNFETTLEFNVLADGDGTLVFKNENASGLPDKDKQLVFPVKIKKGSGETTTVKAYFNNSGLDPEASCNKVFSVERQVPKTTSIARTALEELLKGPSLLEQDQKFFTSINPGVKIQKITIENGIAKVDFNNKLEEAVGGSCRVSAIRAQITQTLKQFSTVKSVIISIDGRTEDILQP